MEEIRSRAYFLQGFVGQYIQIVDQARQIGDVSL